LRSAALAPDLFSELQQTYPQASNDTIRSYLLTKKGFTDTGAESCIEAFRDAQENAKLGDMETALAPVQPVVQPPAPAVPPVPPPASHAQSELPESVTTFRWPLSRGVVAEVRFVGHAKPIHLDLLKKYLDVAKGAMEADEEEQPRRIASNEIEDFTSE
jgi:hypothetical protein